MKYVPLSLIVLYSCFLSAYANHPATSEIRFVETSIVIHDLKRNIKAVKNKTDIPVIFPKIIPKVSAQKYFADKDFAEFGNGATGYRISVNSTPDCGGVRFCSIGYIQAEKGENLEIYYDLDNKEITIPVMLANHIKAYYTPGHAMADFFPPMLQWRDKNVLYTFTWKIDINFLTPQAERNAMVRMVNSAY